MSDRTKPPPGYLLAERGWHTPQRPRLYAEVDTREGGAEAVIADCWAHHDRIAAATMRECADLARALLPTAMIYNEALAKEHPLYRLALTLDAKADELDPGDPKGTP